MFDTRKVAQKIKEARIAKNMTQMNLADAMEVSYQAVSNWERGNSMPDISKLEQLSEILEISIEEMLGKGNGTNAVHKCMQQEKGEETERLTAAEMAEVLPLLSPQRTRKIADEILEEDERNENSESGSGIDIRMLISMAPFLEEEYLDKLAERVDVVDNLQAVIPLAPFLSETALEKLVERLDGCKNWSGIVGLAPFLSEETLDRLVEKWMTSGADGEDMAGIQGLYPFLSSKTMHRLVEQFMKHGNSDEVKNAAPFL